LGWKRMRNISWLAPLPSELGRQFVQGKVRGHPRDNKILKSWRSNETRETLMEFVWQNLFKLLGIPRQWNVSIENSIEASRYKWMDWKHCDIDDLYRFSRQSFENVLLNQSLMIDKSCYRHNFDQMSVPATDFQEAGTWCAFAFTKPNEMRDEIEICHNVAISNKDRTHNLVSRWNIQVWKTREASMFAIN
jgi:hypothetical protein